MSDGSTREPELLASVLASIGDDAALWSDFLALCDHGGRLAGTPGEAAARNWAAGRLEAVSGATIRRDPTPYAGWRCVRAALTSASGEAIPVQPLLGTASTPPAGLELEVLDLGRGTAEEIRAAGPALRGKAVMVRHEFPFLPGTVHRRVKLAAARSAGAAAFLVAQAEPDAGPVSGSSGREGGAGIPAVSISAEDAVGLHGARVHLLLDGEDLPDAMTETLVADLPGGGPDRVVLCAHIDGHPLAESAIDNATGVAGVLALARAVAPAMPRSRRGLTVCLFSAEEWALQGSREWLRRRGEAERARMVLNVNLDSIAGPRGLTALTSGFPRLGAFAQAAVARSGRDLSVHLPLTANSDHANFAALGIPALRLMAGYGDPSGALRLILSRKDTRVLVDREGLRDATLAAGALLWAALAAPDPVIADLARPDA